MRAFDKYWIELHQKLTGRMDCDDVFLSIAQAIPVKDNLPNVQSILIKTEFGQYGYVFVDNDGYDWYNDILKLAIEVKTNSSCIDKDGRYRLKISKVQDKTGHLLIVVYDTIIDKMRFFAIHRGDFDFTHSRDLVCEMATEDNWIVDYEHSSELEAIRYIENWTSHDPKRRVPKRRYTIQKKVFNSLIEAI